ARSDDDRTGDQVEGAARARMEAQGGTGEKSVVGQIISDGVEPFAEMGPSIGDAAHFAVAPIEHALSLEEKGARENGGVRASRREISAQEPDGEDADRYLIRRQTRPNEQPRQSKGDVAV